LRGWDYGKPGQQYPCWTVLDDFANSEIGIAFCEEGFGPACPWGLIFKNDDDGQSASMGMDSGWYPRFLLAFFESSASVRLPVWQVFKMDSNWGSGEAVTGELAWELAWERCEAFRASDPDSRYTVTHPIAVALDSAWAG
jgi:hypothetical protein